MDSTVAPPRRAVPNPATPDEHAPSDLTRITRLAHTALGVPVMLVTVTATSVRLMAATPREAEAVPLRVARQLATAEGPEAITDGDGTTWFGTGVARAASGARVVLCARSGPDGGIVRATLSDLAALAVDVLSLDAAQHEIEALRELLGTASHDLRNPLSVLRAGIETMTDPRNDLTPEQYARVASLTQRQASRMAAMIDGLLSLHGLESGERAAVVDLHEIVRDVLEGGRLVHRMVDLRLRTPTGPEALPVRGVTDSLARLFTNLVTNAAVHGGSTVCVAVRATATDAIVTIEDDGPGMPAGLDDDAHVERHAGGHGLGLVIARRIVEDHAGTITHQARPEGGTVVEVTLPRVGVAARRS